MFNFEGIQPDRQEELLKLSTNESLLADIFDQPFHRRSHIIRVQSRIVLGLEIDVDIADCDSAVSQELLFVMSALRDAVFPKPSDDTMETR